MAAWVFRFSGGGEMARSLSGAGRFVPEGDGRGFLEGAIISFAILFGLGQPMASWSFPGFEDALLWLAWLLSG
jgi:hypothetical protein